MKRCLLSCLLIVMFSVLVADGKPAPPRSHKTPGRQEVRREEMCHCGEICAKVPAHDQCRVPQCDGRAGNLSQGQ
jgi:hypothetical protein